MLGQTQQNATPPPGIQSLEGRAFEQRTAGPYSYRAASADWRKVVLATLEEWYATDKPYVVEGIDRYPVASLVGMPPHMGTAGRSTGAKIVQQMEDSGGGVVFLPEGYKGTLVRVELAEEAQRLTAADPTKTAVVLSEPAAGWSDTTTAALAGRYAAFPAGLVVGLMTTVSLMKVFQR
jgi:hypothetical protein